MTMYVPPHHNQTDMEELARLIHEFPLATIVTTGTNGLAANHIPLQFDAGVGSHGVLRGHVARNNGVWRETDIDSEVLVVFQAPDAYITPNWYATKQISHEVVPTWNYAVVHAYGRIVFHDNEKWLRGVIGKLTKTMESDQPKPWSMAQAPREYLAAQLTEIVGVEIEITRLIAKWKTSQNRSEEDREGVVAGLRADVDGANAWMVAAVEDTLDT